MYSTCTFAPEENEQTIEKFLVSHPEFALEDVDAPWFTPAGKGKFRLWPHKLLGEGHFAAVLRKTDGKDADISPVKSEKLPKEWAVFAKDLAIDLPEGNPIFFGQSLYLAPPEMPDLRGVKVLRPGLELGEVKKDRFEPAHALALWLKTAANTKLLSAEGPESAAYMQGQTIPDTGKGWTLVQVGGYSLGWGKSDGKVLKNHYPKGLRR